MFDLESAIQQWRGEFTGTRAVTPDDLVELEGHLRESMRAVQARGLTEEESFVIAAMRLGRPATLRREFAKLDQTQLWSDRMLWIIGGYVGGTCLRTAVEGLGQIVLMVGTRLQLSGATASALATLCAASCWFLILLLLVRIAHVGRPGLGRLTITGSLGALVGLLVLGGVLRVVGQVELIRHAPLEVVADAAQWTIWGQLLVQSSLLFASLALIAHLKRRTIELANAT